MQGRDGVSLVRAWKGWEVNMDMAYVGRRVKCGYEMMSVFFMFS